MKPILLALVACLMGCAAHPSAFTVAGAPHAPVCHSEATGPLRIVVVGLVHGHAEGLLWNAQHRDDIDLVGVYEPNRALFDRLAGKYNLDSSLRYDDLARMLEETEPEAASIMTSIADHAEAIETCAAHGVHTLVEKPLAFSRADANRIERAANKHGVLVLTNYETSWYASVREAGRLVDSGEMAPVRRMVFRHGHPGPREIGCSEEFLEWLTDPKENGGGAIVDFGCYGAALALWMMNGEKPISVTAAANTLKPDVYPNVDDDATIVLEFESATAVIQASWAWTHDNKEMDVYTETGSIHAGKWDALSTRAPNQPAVTTNPPPLPDDYQNEWTYLRRVVRGECEVDPLSSLDLNITVAEILDEAREQIGR
ncbi:MAG: Gfo/Idh/MocA family oxidoreductase [Phycisphaerales bacterium]|nr:Gfo/Idh/MocA family oxidoreductase [Phycisphaerales bacterium]MCB9835792.1 Gfo/Idh/MocA family oxidoreductase [Phycisphaera sp.]